MATLETLPEPRDFFEYPQGDEAGPRRAILSDNERFTILTMADGSTKDTDAYLLHCGHIVPHPNWGTWVVVRETLRCYKCHQGAPIDRPSRASTREGVASYRVDELVAALAITLERITDPKAAAPTVATLPDIREHGHLPDGVARLQDRTLQVES
jgi:hypothetical protein